MSAKLSAALDVCRLKLQDGNIPVIHVLRESGLRELVEEARRTGVSMDALKATYDEKVRSLGIPNDSPFVWMWYQISQPLNSDGNSSGADTVTTMVSAVQAAAKTTASTIAQPGGDVPAAP